jgi:hypothetical protein
VTGDFDGAVWFRKSIQIPEKMTGKALVLSLGPIDDMTGLILTANSSIA